jgi:hypothetical protein
MSATGQARSGGILAGAAIGAVGRVVVMSLHLSTTTDGTILILLIAALVGALVGALASLPGRPLTGALVGAVLSGALYLGALPAVWLLHLLGAVSLPSLLEMIAVGALAGGVGGLIAQRGARRAALRSPAVRAR